jgi:hypothetical protein
MGRIGAATPSGKPIENELHQERRHGRSFSVVKPIDVAQIVRRAGFRLQPAAAVTVDEIFGDGARFGQRQPAVGYDRRFAERMHGAQFRRRQHGRGMAPIGLDFIRKIKLLKQPEDAVRARLLEVMDGDHEGQYSARALTRDGCCSKGL